MTQWLQAHDLVSAEPFRVVLRRLIESSRYTDRRPDCRHGGTFATGKARTGENLWPLSGAYDGLREVVCGGRTEVVSAYAKRFGVTTRTAERHISMVQQRNEIPLVIADRIACLAGEPLEYVLVGVA